MSEVQACATCHFWEEQSKHCRRYAPSPTLGNNDSDGRQNAFWVMTDAEDWCGDYESVLEEEKEEDEDLEEYEEEDVDWDADGTPKWSPPPPAPPAQRGLFR